MRPEQIHALLAGDRLDLWGRFARCVLACLEPLYAGAVCCRNAAFNCGWRRPQRVQCPVVSVGNLTTGGTGKTPVVAWLVEQLRRQGRQPGILSRGYRSLDANGNDEKRVLDLLCPGVPHVQLQDRILGAKQLLTQCQSNVIVLDDAFQHRRLHRDVDLVLIDALNPWGYGHLLPRGLLREPISGLQRATAVFITRCDAVDSQVVDSIRQVVEQHSVAPCLRTRFAVQGLRAFGGTPHGVADFGWDHADVGAFCGIGNPAGFSQTLQGLVGGEVSLQVFPDHHHYTDQDLADLIAVQPHKSRWLTTLKDLVKVQRQELGGVPLYALDIGIEFLDPVHPVLELLERTVVRFDPEH